MPKMGTQCLRVGNRSGYAMLLITLFCILISIFIYLYLTSGPAIEIGIGPTDETMPWQEWETISDQVDKNGIQFPSEDQPAITIPLLLKAELDQQGQGRGNISIFSHPDGNIAGHWSGEFIVSPNVDHQVMSCDFKGYINPSKIYINNFI